MNIKEILFELKRHVPFTFAASAIAVILSLAFYKTNLPKDLFEIAHPLHILASAIVTAGIFNKYKKNILYSIILGMTGSIIIGSLSDIIFPYFGGIVFNLSTSFHLPLIETPAIILFSALIGGLIGLKTKITELPHFIHVFLSVFGSLFYLLAFSSFSFSSFIIIFIITLFAVLVPCCFSDIIYPLLFIKDKRN